MFYHIKNYNRHSTEVPKCIKSGTKIVYSFINKLSKCCIFLYLSTKQILLSLFQTKKLEFSKLIEIQIICTEI